MDRYKTKTTTQKHKQSNLHYIFELLLRNLEGI